MYLIEESAFREADNIVSVTLPDSVLIIGSGAFFRCANLTTVIIPESIIRIEAYAFYECRKLTGINTLGKITQIHDSTFYGCAALTSITIPEGVTHIDDDAFQYCKNLASVKLPDSLEEIGSSAFAICTELVDISIPPNVRKIKYHAFEDCIRLSKITLPDTIRVIEKSVFASCAELAEIKIPDSIRVIEDSAFENCTALSEVTIPPSVTKISAFAFRGCHNLRIVTIQNDAVEIMFNAFHHCKNMVTNFSIKEWDRGWGINKSDYALHYMRNFEAGNPFFENTKEENKRYIRHQLYHILDKEAPGESYIPLFSDDEPPDFIRSDDTDVVLFLTNEIPLRIDEVEILLDKIQGNIEATAILLDYRKRTFSEEFLEKYENDKLQKDLGLKERTIADWKKIFSLGDDGDDGYIILGYKGKDVNVDIPEKIGKKPVTAIDDSAFSPFDDRNILDGTSNRRLLLESVFIPDSVTYIGHNVFWGCDNLSSIVYLGKTFTPEEFEDYCSHNFPVRIIIKEK